MKKMFGGQTLDITQFATLSDGSSKRLRVEDNSDFSNKRFENG